MFKAAADVLNLEEEQQIKQQQQQRRRRRWQPRSPCRSHAADGEISWEQTKENIGRLYVGK